MPQMAPMLWLVLFFYFIILFVFYISNFYFMVSPQPKSVSSDMISGNCKFIWSW